MASRKPKRHPGGRPSQGLTEARLLLEAPSELVEAAREAARVEGVPAVEWWRRAARERLGWAKARRTP